MGNKSDNISCAPVYRFSLSLSLSHYFLLLAPPIMGYRIRDNELQFCMRVDLSALDIHVLSLSLSREKSFPSLTL